MLCRRGDASLALFFTIACTIIQQTYLYWLVDQQVWYDIQYDYEMVRYDILHTAEQVLVLVALVPSNKSSLRYDRSVLFFVRVSYLSRRYYFFVANYSERKFRCCCPL